MECINNKCNSNDHNGKCKRTGEFVCGIRRIKTPSYAAEQLEHAQDKKIKELENELEAIRARNQELVKENEELIERNNLLEKRCKLKEEIDTLVSNGYKKIKELEKEVSDLKMRNENQRSNVAYEIEQRKKFKAEINQLIEENKEVKRLNEELQETVSTFKAKVLEKDEAIKQLVAYGEDCNRIILELETANKNLKLALDSSNELRKREADTIKSIDIEEEKQKRRELAKMLLDLL